MSFSNNLTNKNNLSSNNFFVFLQNRVFKDYVDLKLKKSFKLQIWKRSLTIRKKYFGFLNPNVEIYNGKSFYSFLLKKSLIGYKFGSFSFTRKKTLHLKKNNKKKKK